MVFLCQQIKEKYGEVTKNNLDSIQEESEDEDSHASEGYGLRNSQDLFSQKKDSNRSKKTDNFEEDAIEKYYKN